MRYKYPGNLIIYGRRILDGSKIFPTAKSYWDYIWYPPPAKFNLGRDASPSFNTVDVSAGFNVADVSPVYQGEVVN